MKLNVRLLKQPILLPLALAGILAAFPTLGADTFGGLFGDPILVKGKNVEVRRSQLDDAFIAFRANLAARGEDIRDDQRLDRENSLLERLVLTQILSTLATDEDRKAAGVLAKKFLEDARKAAGDNDAAFERQLRSLGLNVKQFSDRVTEQSLVETVLDRVLKSSITIPEDQMHKFYDENPERFRQAEVAKGSHIVMYTRDQSTGTDLAADIVKPKQERLQRALSRARAGEDFQVLLAEYTEDKGAVEKKGEFLISKINRVPEVEAVAFSMPLNSISEIITTPGAMVILKTTERIPAKTLEFSAMKEDITKFLSHRELEKKLPEYFGKLKQEAALEVTDLKYKPAIEKVSSNAFEGGLGK